MRDPQRIDRIINKLRKYWKTYPDLRLCQMIFNVATQLSEEMGDMFYVEDDEFEKRLDQKIKEYENTTK